VNRSLIRIAKAAAALVTMFIGVLIVIPASSAQTLRDSIVATARTELGNANRDHEEPMGSNCNYYSGYWGTGSNSCSKSGFRSVAWCADFAKYIWAVGGVTNRSGLNSWAYSFWRYGLNNDTWHARGSGYTPKPGDAVVYDWDPPFNPSVYEDIDHVGIVESYSGGTLTTIEGNTSDQTLRHTRSGSSNVIVGYTSPVGADAPSTPPAIVQETSSQAFDYLDQLHYVARSTTDTLSHQMFKPGTGWAKEDLGGQVAGQVTGVVYTALNQGHVFGRSPNNTLVHWYFIPGTGWGREDLGGQFVGDPSASTWNNQLHVFARTAANTLVHWFFIPGDGWGTENLGGQLVGDPAASTWGDQLHAFGRAADNTLNHWFFIPGDGWDTENLGGQLVGDPAASTWGDQVHVFGRAGNNTLSHWGFVPGSGWARENLGGTLVADPAASIWRDQLHSFGRAADGTLTHWYFIPGTGWGNENLGGTLHA
jgi:hypothetical protein